MEQTTPFGLSVLAFYEEKVKKLVKNRADLFKALDNLPQIVYNISMCQNSRFCISKELERMLFHIYDTESLTNK